ncbi:hypothetical protein ANCCAN_08401 [Ancylostoma caninum]|uniref:Uncharacterized protein n=1 Tax=Ancylostoma caninum TaxID=29170 RepID=A0A368GMF3_ANCCA|nr:hypothetical protein ANCCAN_08401 [Ancylostoma caninum]
MRVLLGLAVLASLISLSTAKDGSPNTEAGSSQTNPTAAQPCCKHFFYFQPSMTLRELLNAYQSEYEKQFHEPLPENQKTLLAALPRFNSGSILKAQRSADWQKAFQQDSDPKKLDEKEAKSTTLIQKREITSVPPKDMSTATVPPTQGTATEMSNFITERAPMNEMQTTEEKMERSPTPAQTTMTTNGPTPQADTTVRMTSTTVMGRKLTDLHPEMKQAPEAKAKPVIVQEVMPSPKMAEMPPKIDAVQRQENQSQPPKMTSSRPMTTMPKTESTSMPATDKTTRARPNPSSPASQATGSTMPMTKAEMKTETKPKLAPIKMSSVNPAQMKPRRLPALRAPKIPKKNVAGMRPRGMKPVPRQMQRPQSNLKVR